ncbi:MAG: DUF1697 domain-containing protein [Gaiellaceae bacterium]
MNASTTFVALLRGINVGGKRKIPMAELRSLFSSLGFEDIVTYIQSGNVVFRSTEDDADEISARVEREIVRAFEMDPAVLLRTPAELEEIAERNPYRARTDLSKLHVVFLDRIPAASAAADLDPGRSPGDEFTLQGREIYLHLPHGSGRSKLTIDYFERRLRARATARNWKTLLELVELSQR